MPSTVLEEDQDLLNAGLINQNAELTPQGTQLLQSAEQSGENPDEMLDFFLKGWIDTDLNLTEDGIIWEGVMERGLQDILDEPNQAQGFVMYERAAKNGALDWWKNETGEDYETTGEFVEHAVENFLPMAGQMFGELVKVPGGLWKTAEVAERAKPWYLQTPLGWVLQATMGDPSEEELQRVRVGVDAYAKEGLIRMPATFANGAMAAITHGPVTGKAFTDEDRLMSAYLYRKNQHDIENLNAGVATATALDFGMTMSGAVANLATFGTVDEELEELVQDVREGQIVDAAGNIKTAEHQLNALDRLEGIDPSIPWQQRPGQQKTRVEKAQATGTAVGMILSPDTLATLGYATLPKAGLTAVLRKGAALTGELIELEAKRNLLRASQKAAAASPHGGKAAAAGLQKQISNLDETIRLTQKRLDQVAKATDPKAVAALGALGRKLRSTPLKATGATLEATGGILKKINPALSATASGAAFFAMTGNLPFAAAFGLVAGITGRGGRMLSLGQKISRLGAEWTRRRTAIPYFRKLAEESTDSAFKRNLYLAGEMAISKPIRLTNKFADIYRRAFIAEVPFSYIAAGGASYAGGNWLTDAMAEALAFEAPIGMTGHLAGSVMGMKTAGTVEEQNRLAMNAALNFRDEFLRDPEKRKAFDNLSPVAKKALGNYHTAFPDVHWDFDVTVENGSSYYDEASNTIRINPADPRGAEVAMAHEFRHYLDVQGFQQPVIMELIGPQGILRVGDGKGGTTLMPSFVTWAHAENKLRGEKWDLSKEDSQGWADAALEWSAYSSMDGMARSVRHNALIEAAQKHPWMRSLFDAIMPSSYRQKSLMNMGLLFEPDGTVAVRKGLPGRDAYKQQAAVAKRIQRYMRDRAGIGITDADRADLTDPESKSKKDPNAILPTDPEGLNQVEPLLTPDFQHDAQGNIIRDEKGEPILESRAVLDAREGNGKGDPMPQIASLAGEGLKLNKVNVGRGTDNGTDLTGAIEDAAQAARLKELLRSLAYSEFQLGMLDEIIDILTNDKRKGESLLGLAITVWQKRKAKGNWRNFVKKDGIKAKWVRYTPYSLVQTGTGNLLVYAISQDQVALNIATLAKSAEGRRLYDGNVGRITSDFELMVKNYGKGTPNVGQFSDAQLNFLNAIFGNLGRGHPEFNPNLEKAPFKGLRPTVKSFRIERFGRQQTLPRDPFPFALEKGKRRELPFEEQSMEGQMPYNEPGNAALMDWETFQRAAEEGKLHQATGEATPEEEAAQSPLTRGIAAGYPAKDVAHFYATRDKDKRRGAWEMAKDAQDEGLPINASLWDEVVTRPPEGYTLSDGIYYPKTQTPMGLKIELTSEIGPIDTGVYKEKGKEVDRIAHYSYDWKTRQGTVQINPEEWKKAPDGWGTHADPGKLFIIAHEEGHHIHNDYLNAEEKGLLEGYWNELDPRARNAISALHPSLRPWTEWIPYHYEHLQKAKDTGSPYIPDDPRMVELVEKAIQREGQTASDADYLAAVEQGDTETAQRMVDRAAGVPEVFDSAKGYGQVSNNQEVNYLGFRLYLTPSEFKNLVPKGVSGPKTKDFITGKLRAGEKIGQPFFEAKWDEESKNWTVFDHEGRSRSDAFQELFGEQPMEVHIFPRNLRARNISPEMRRANWVGQDGNGKLEFSPEMNADPVTYDDQGNVIPLSRRFDTGNDIRGEVGRPTTPVAEPGQRREMPLEQPDQHGMRSSLVENLSDKVQGKRASADQLKALIAPKKGLVNQEEAKWLMVEDLIDRLAEKHNGKVPVAEFFEELRNRGDQLLNEVVLSDRAEVKPIYGTSTLTLPGGVDYKERVLVVGESPPLRYIGGTISHVRHIDYTEFARDYSSPHVNDETHPGLGKRAKGYVAHSRQKTREAEDGTTGTFIEELQSDRHQRGKKDGYNEHLFEDEARILKEELKRVEGQLDKAIAESELQNRLREEYNEIWNKLTPLTDRIPDAPYRDSNAWILALFKRALKDAVDQNHDWIGWTEGDTQNTRYNIALNQFQQMFKYLEWNGTHLTAEKRNGETMKVDNVTRDNLAEYVGETHADTLKEQYDDEKWERDQMTEEELEDDDLGELTAVIELDTMDTWGDEEGQGGNPEPFRRMYDKQVPRVVSKYLKKHKVKANPDKLIDGQEFWRVPIPESLRTEIREKGQSRF
jgi:hypothetical protein